MSGVILCQTNESYPIPANYLEYKQLCDHRHSLNSTILPQLSNLWQVVLDASACVHVCVCSSFFYCIDTLKKFSYVAFLSNVVVAMTHYGTYKFKQSLKCSTVITEETVLLVII